MEIKRTWMLIKSIQLWPLKRMQAKLLSRVLIKRKTILCQPLQKLILRRIRSLRMLWSLTTDTEIQILNQLSNALTWMKRSWRGAISSKKSPSTWTEATSQLRCHQLLMRMSNHSRRSWIPWLSTSDLKQWVSLWGLKSK